MKIFTKLTLVALLAMGSFSAASAAAPANEIFITGSTAYRGAVINAIHDILAPGFVYAYAGSSEAGNAAIYSGTTRVASANQFGLGILPAGTAVIIATSWNGSGAGVANVADGSGSSPANYIPYSNSAQSGATAGTAAGTFYTMSTTGQTLGFDPTGTAAATDKDSEVAHIALSDVFQSATGFIGSVTWADTTVHNYTTLVDRKVGVVPFQFVSSAQTKFTNITTQQATALFTGLGTLPLSQFTGSAADASTTIYALGRNPDSGTRITAAAETAIGAFTGLFQYQPLDSSSAFINGTTGGTISSLQPWPVETINHVSTGSQGNSGYSSGGNLAKTLGGNTLSIGSSAVLLTYLSTSDAATATTGGNTGVTLSYNGFPYSVAAVQNGQYTFWSYEHLLYPNPTGLTATTKGVISLLSTDLNTGIAGGPASGNPTATITTTSMHVTRSSDGGTVQ